jgi:hypothetical protein
MLIKLVPTVDFNKCASWRCDKGICTAGGCLIGHLYRRKFMASLCMMHLDAKAAAFVQLRAR